MRVVWTKTAIRHLQHVRNYIAEEEPIAARKVATTLHEATSKLAEFPAIGRPGRVPNTRELVIPHPPFIIPYTVDSDRVLILAVMHTSREWPESF